MHDRIYGIYDRLAERVIGPLLFFPADAAAARMFTDVVRSPGSEVNSHPRDYDLVCFGTMVREKDSTHIDPIVTPLLFPVLTGAAVLDADEAARTRVQTPPQMDLVEA